MVNPAGILAFFLIVCVVFVPALIISLVMLRSGRRAFVLAATFSIAAIIGFMVFTYLGTLVIEHHQSDTRSTFEVLLFGTAGASGIAVLAVWLLGKLTGHAPWRRDP